MAPPTRSNALEHVLVSVLKVGTETNSAYRMAFTEAGIETIDDLLDMDKDDLRSISWESPDGDRSILSIGNVNTLMSIGSWFRTQSDTDDAVFLSLTPAMLTAHRRSVAATPTVPLPAAGGSLSARHTTTLSLLTSSRRVSSAISMHFDKLTKVGS